MIMDNQFVKDFPILADAEFSYLDNAATTQKPSVVLEAGRDYYETSNANPLRGLYDLSVKATDVYENARQKMANFIGAKSAEEIVFTRNATESLNLIAYSYGMSFLKPGDEIVISIMEHHSNMLPWQNVAKKTGAVLKYVMCDKTGKLTADMLKSELSEKTAIVSIAHISNVFGCKNDVKEFASLAHEVGAIFVADGAQSVPHISVNVEDLDVDFLSFSGHKMYAPMGIGGLYGKKEILEKMPPFLYGGEMIEYVTIEGATYAPVPHKFEAGTVNAGGAGGLSAAIDYINGIGFEKIEEIENELTKELLCGLKEIPYVNVVGSDDYLEHHGIVTFTVDGVHPHDIAAILDSDGVYVRAGHHCAQPLMKYLGTPSTARASLSFYNSSKDVNRFLESVSKLREKMGYKD